MSTATATATASLPATRVGSPTPPARLSTPPPPPPSKAVPTDFRSSLSAWWNNSSYRDARVAEERLLRRLSMFEPTQTVTPVHTSKGWFGSHEKEISASETALGNARAGDEVVPPLSVPGNSGLVATLRNVFIPTPDPAQAPAHPADPLPSEESAASSSSSLPSTKSGVKKHHGHHLHLHGKKGDSKHADYINTLELSTPENANSKEAVVVLHGYAAALGFFYRNWDSVATASNNTGRRTFFLDWLGMGLSSRPSPALLSSPSATPIPARVSRAEHFFLASLESWRQAAGLDKMVLVGHSLGGYLASAYAVRYPQRVSGLILVSPAGIPHGPEYKRYPLSGEEGEQVVDAVELELNSDQNEAKGEAKQWRENRDRSFARRNMMKFFVWGWEKGISPFQFLRSMGPWGPMFAGRYSLRRFAAQSEEDIRDLHAYIYNTSILRGSGEYCISHILAPGAYARVPIVDRIAQVKVPVTFLYGDNDWMDVDGGRASLKVLKEAGNDNCSVHVVPNAGHHLYLDNPEFSNRVIGEAIQALPKLQTQTPSA
ncbi:Alpha/Beta hydrolase protein [Naematelia encephala]|uniref:Alpha/Beta hydrolase protein n=1 Tax=Naematelia encephala TaxID=71784 RepID=A0A1Y2BJR1_9TREE|nr:Alpha/Beta hydrolase protein [Naematelia encephala]